MSESFADAISDEVLARMTAPEETFGFLAPVRKLERLAAQYLDQAQKGSGLAEDTKARFLRTLRMVKTLKRSYEPSDIVGKAMKAMEEGTGATGRPDKPGTMRRSAGAPAVRPSGESKDDLDDLSDLESELGGGESSDEDGDLGGLEREMGEDFSGYSLLRRRPAPYAGAAHAILEHRYGALLGGRRRQTKDAWRCAIDLASMGYAEEAEALFASAYPRIVRREDKVDPRSIGLPARMVAFLQASADNGLPHRVKLLMAEQTMLRNYPELREG